MSEPRARFPWGLTLAVIPALVLLLSLGVWQVQRLHWKEYLIAEAEATAAAPPIGVENLQGFRSFEFQKLSLICPGLDTAPYVELQTIHDGQPGVRLISLCVSEPVRFGDGQVGYRFVVDRGFIPDTVSARPAQQLSDKPVLLTAEIRTVPDAGGMTPPPEGHRFYGRDLEAMTEVLLRDQERLGARNEERMLWGYWLYATTSSNPDWPALQPSAPPAAFSNNHLGYAMTWFGLAIVLVGFYIALLRRRIGAPPSEKSST
ncbi:SURF1 family protein [Brevundimonas sp. GCM10030266]|uniref:SURF1 family protein n=1 Tax=Brevundimonas sp. GCM10030266 TaxID=3273386 RepID=UPI003614033B